MLHHELMAALASFRQLQQPAISDDDNTTAGILLLARNAQLTHRDLHMSVTSAPCVAGGSHGISQQLDASGQH
jgi:hypothetical protein